MRHAQFTANGSLTSLPLRLGEVPTCLTSILWLKTTFILFTGEGNGNPLQHSCLENPVEGGAW